MSELGSKRSSLDPGIRWALLCLGLILIAGLVFSGRSREPTNRGISQNRLALASKLGPVRPLEGRLTGGFTYLPLEEKAEVMEGQIYGYKQPRSLTLSQSRNAATLVRKIERDYASSPTSESIGDKALLTFLPNRWDLREGAISLLRDAVEQSPDNANLLTDLAAGYLASTNPDIPGNFMALSAASRALKINPSLHEAKFNLALALERCNLLRQARSAWEDYLRLDPKSEWSEEARDHLRFPTAIDSRMRWSLTWKRRMYDRTANHIPRSLYQVARDDTSEETLGHWAELVLQGRRELAHRELAMAKMVGEWLGKYSPDRTVLDAVSAVDGAAKMSQLTAIVQGHLSYREGTRHLRAGELTLARPHLEVAKRKFIASGSPLQYWVDFYLADIAFRLAELPVVENLLRSIRAEADLSRYPGLNARLLYLDGLIYLHHADLSSAQREFRMSRYAARLGGDHEFEAVAAIFTAETAEPFDSHAWFHRRIAVRALGKMSTPRYEVLVLRRLADVFIGTSPEVSVYLLNEAIEVAGTPRAEGLLIEALISRSRALRQIGEEKRAQQDLATAHRMLRAIADPVLRKELEIYDSVTTCQKLSSVSPDICIPKLTEGISHYSVHEPGLLPELYKLRAEAFHAVGKDDAQEADLLTALNTYELALRSQPSIGKLFLLDRQADDITDTLTNILIKRGDLVQAFNLEERSRLTPLKRAELKESVAWGGTGCNLRPYSKKEFSSGLPASTAVVEYMVYDEGISAWVFRSGSVRRVRLPIEKKKLLQYLPADAGKSNVRYPRLKSPELAMGLLEPLRRYLPVGGDIIFLIEPLLDSVDFCSLVQGDHGVGIISPTEQHSTKGNLASATAIVRQFLARDLSLSYSSRGADRGYLSAQQLTRRVPLTTTAVEYSFVGDRLVAWIVRNNRLTLVPLKANRKSLLGLIRQDTVRADGYRGKHGMDRLETLFNQLVAPLSRYLPSGGDLLIIPDEDLALVPFAAMHDPKAGKFLIENYSLSVSPSISLFVAHVNQASPPPHDRWTAFVVNNPVSEERTSRQFPSLPGATAEAKSIVQIFPGSEIVSGREAKIYRMGGVSRHEILHFVGHWDPRYRTYDGTINPDEMSAGENVQLVVLSACRTAVGRGLRGFGIAEPLLAQGTPAVVASLWNIDDRSSSQLLTRFYKHLRSGMTGANALRAAQLDLLRGDDEDLRSPSSWAGIQLLGFGGI